MTTKRKPLPYAASWLLDQALMHLADATRAIKPIIEIDMTELEKARRIGMAIYHQQEAANVLKEIKEIRND